MIVRIAAVLLLSAGTLSAAPKGTVKLKTLDGGRVEVWVNGEHFATYNPNDKGTAPKPYFYPVKGPGGTVLSRAIARKGDDHPHHKGIWVAVDEVNGVRFWAEKGRIVTRKLRTSVSENTGHIDVVNAWVGPSGTTEVTEITKIAIHPNRLMEYDITFKAGKKPVEFGDTKEGLFGFRMVNAMRERQGGRVVDSRGKKGTKACWGETAGWIDYDGQVDGKTFGVAIFDHPENFRKSRYHVRDYGLFSINPFGQKAYTKGKLPAQPYTIRPGKTLRLRYAMYFHAGDTQSAKVESVYDAWVARTKK